MYSFLFMAFFIVLTSCQADIFEGERCNDVILYEIVKKAAKTSSDLGEIRQNAMTTMQKVFPLARSMGCICTDHKFQFPDFTSHRYCSVAISKFKCHAIVF